MQHGWHNERAAHAFQNNIYLAGLLAPRRSDLSGTGRAAGLLPATGCCESERKTIAISGWVSLWRGTGTSSGRILC